MDFKFNTTVFFSIIYLIAIRNTPSLHW